MCSYREDEEDLYICRKLFQFPKRKPKRKKSMKHLNRNSTKKKEKKSTHHLGYMGKYIIYLEYSC